MKSKFAGILGAGLTIALLATLVTVAVPISALSQPNVAFPTLEDDDASRVDADYIILFMLNKELGSLDSITITFPSDTIVATPTATIAATAGWIGGMWKNATLNNPTANWTYSAPSRTVTKTLDTGSEIGEAATVRIEITAGITNPSAPDSYTLTVHTSQETTPVTSSTYAITVPPLIFASYSDEAHTVACDNFTVPVAESTVYMYGTGVFPGGYRVAYYDGSDTRRVTDDVTSDALWNMSSQHTFVPGTDIAGTWNVIICESSYTPPDSYNSTWSYTITSDNFTVQDSAIPEFPTVIAAIVAFSLCFVIYLWMRRKAVPNPG